MPFYESGRVRIHYEEVGSGFPLLVIPGRGLNSTVAGFATHPFNPFDEFKGEFRVIAPSELRRLFPLARTVRPPANTTWAYEDSLLGQNADADYCQGIAKIDPYWVSDCS